jgi:hypothetical protein
MDRHEKIAESTGSAIFVFQWMMIDGIGSYIIFRK